MHFVLATVLLIAALPISAQIYQYSDEQGQPIFTDKPPLGVDARHVVLPSLNSVPAPTEQTSSSQSQTDNSTAEQAAPYSVLQLINLPDAVAIRANNGSFRVRVKISPRLANQHRLQLLIDGQPYGASRASTRLSVENLDRGEHRIAVQVLADDQVVQSSAEQSINVQRVHTNSPLLRP